MWNAERNDRLRGFVSKLSIKLTMHLGTSGGGVGAAAKLHLFSNSLLAGSALALHFVLPLEKAAHLRPQSSQAGLQRNQVRGDALAEGCAGVVCGTAAPYLWNDDTTAL